MSGIVKNFVAATGVMISLSSNAEPIDLGSLNLQDLEISELQEVGKQLNDARKTLRSELRPLMEQAGDKFVFMEEDSSVKSLVLRAESPKICFNESSGVMRVEGDHDFSRERDFSRDLDRRESKLESWFKDSLNLGVEGDGGNRAPITPVYSDDPEVLARYAEDVRQQMIDNLEDKQQSVQGLANLKNGLEWIVGQDSLQFTGHWKKGQAPEGVAQHDVIIYPIDEQTGQQTVYITNLMQRGGTYDFIVDMVDTLKDSPDVVVALNQGDADNGFKYQATSDIQTGVDVSEVKIIGSCTP